MTDKPKSEYALRIGGPDLPLTPRDWIGVSILALVGFVLGSCMIVGAYEITKWGLEWLRG